MSEKQIFVPFDLYCERAYDGSFWAEPVNFLTNFAFIIAAILIAVKAKKINALGLKTLDFIILSVTLFLIGVGSGLYHSYPTKLTLLADMIPIAIFIHLYIPVFFSRIIRLKIWQSILVVLGFIGFSIAVNNSFPPTALNGSISYVPALLMLVLMTLILRIKQAQALAKYLFLTVIIWVVSITFRTFDIKICEEALNIGTHFMWHILNAIVLYRCLNLLLLIKNTEN